ncbi:cupin domain-containing protein [Temperatibacter marinus]|uniref:Cupin domain-containing protein n=1 Tax=Temperatibacter marinus TaxID=1456591 RepID=A0AA52HAE0_9PROT|nr:cupin domain-containing protein [Temperatibacter marinus]WND03864.1 cupin domain-containing protein [Temperatibacter marinus]
MDTSVSEKFLLSESLPKEQVAKGVFRQIHGYNKDIMLVRAYFDKDGIGAMHNHFHSQVTYVESGRFAVTIDGEEKILAAGDSFFIPPHEDHGAVCLEEGTLVDVFSPVREDFLRGEGLYNED